MNASAVGELAVAIVEAGLAGTQELAGCSSEDIQRVREVAGSLPTIYEDFLRRMGRGAGRYAGDVDMFFPALLGLRQRAEQLLADIDQSLPENFFVFSMLNDCAFMCFDPRTSDPIVKRYVEGATAFVDLGTLSQFFQNEALRLMADARERRRHNRPSSGLFQAIFRRRRG